MLVCLIVAETPYIRRGTIQVIKYRNKKTGRFIRSTSKVTGKLLKVPRGAKKEEYSYRLTTYGKYSLGLKIPDQEIITKKIKQVGLDEWNGNLTQAIGASNIYTELPTAEFVDVTISGKTSKNQRYTLKQSLRIGPIKKKRAIVKLLIAKIMAQMEGAGFRVDYPLPMISQYRTKKETSALRVLKDVTITVRVRK